MDYDDLPKKFDDAVHYIELGKNARAAKDLTDIELGLHDSAIKFPRNKALIKALANFFVKFSSASNNVLNGSANLSELDSCRSDLVKLVAMLKNAKLIDPADRAIKFLQNFDFRHARDELEILANMLKDLAAASLDAGHRSEINKIQDVVRATIEKIGRPDYDASGLKDDAGKLQKLKELLAKL